MEDKRKPIFIILLSGQTDNETAEEIRRSTILNEIRKDYHIIVTRNSSEDIDFKMFSESNIDSIELERLQELVLSSLNK